MIGNLTKFCLPLMLAALLAVPSHAQTPGANKTAANNQLSSETPELKRRIQQLEQRLIDVQSMVGTLESMSRQGGRPSAPANSPSASPQQPPDISSFRFNNQPNRGNNVSEMEDRISGVETQIRALAGQLSQLNEQIQRMEARLGSSPAPGPQPFSPPNTAPQRFNERTDPSRSEGKASPSFSDSQEGDNGFSSTLITKGIPSNTGPPIDGGRQRTTKKEPVENSSMQVAAAKPSDPKALYEQAYGQLLSRNYAGAEASFRHFLAKFPNDRLAGNAQYWLGETFYVRGNYRQAADSFLKGYTKYAKSPKAPDSLLKLAMSLKKLGQNEAACTTFLELNAKYPAAPKHIKLRAETEKRLTGC